MGPVGVSVSLLCLHMMVWWVRAIPWRGHWALGMGFPSPGAGGNMCSPGGQARPRPQ